MVHREDVAGAIIAALERGSPGQVYNVAYYEPARQIAFFEWLSSELNRPLPPSAPATAAGDSRRGVTNKRVELPIQSRAW